MTRAEAEAAVVAAERDLQAARVMLAEAQRWARDAEAALASARGDLRRVLDAEEHARRLEPVWLVPPAVWASGRRVDAVDECGIRLCTASGAPVEYSRTTGFVRFARGPAKVQGGQFDVPATLAAWNARGGR